MLTRFLMRLTPAWRQRAIGIAIAIALLPVWFVIAWLSSRP